MSQQISRQRFVGIDVLRTFAILCVVLNHCTENIYAFTLEGLGGLSHISRVFGLSGFTLTKKATSGRKCDQRLLFIASA